MHPQGLFAWMRTPKRSADLGFASWVVTGWNRRSCVVSEDPRKAHWAGVLSQRMVMRSAQLGGPTLSVPPSAAPWSSLDTPSRSPPVRAPVRYGGHRNKAEGADKPRVLVPAEGAEFR